jgi:hypothetical protein
MKITPAPQLNPPATNPTNHHVEQRRTLKIQTNFTPERMEYPAQTETQTQSVQRPAPAAAQDPADNSAPNEQAQQAPEDKKPLSPQFAALMKRERAVQVKEAAIAKREEALKNAPQSTPEANVLIERIKTDPLGTIADIGGWDYQKLTDLVMKEMEGGGPALTKVEQQLTAKIEQLQKQLSDRDEAAKTEKSDAEKAQSARLRSQAEHLVSTDDNYLMIRETKSYDDVTALISAVRKDEGVELTVKEACDLVEKDLLDESLKIARIPKVQSSLSPQQTQPGAQNGSPAPMRTLTNRDSTIPQYSRRERAIAAALGKKLG